jgi:hypothetical protein
MMMLLLLCEHGPQGGARAEQTKPAPLTRHRLLRLSEALDGDPLSVKLITDRGSLF